MTKKLWFKQILPVALEVMREGDAVTPWRPLAIREFCSLVEWCARRSRPREGRGKYE